MLKDGSHYIRVSDSAGSGYVITCYGPYVSESEAEKNLRQRGWKQASPYYVWLASNALAQIIEFQVPKMNPRNQLPHNTK